MTQPGANLYTQGFGSRPENVEVPHIDIRPPNTSDIYPLGKRWIDQVGKLAYVLTNLTSSASGPSANWIVGGDIISITADSGSATPAAGNININGTANQITTTGSGSTITLALAGPYTPATYTAHGVLIGEGTSSIVATSVGSTGQVLIGSTGADPAFGALGVNSGLTAHGVLLGENNSAIVATAVGSTGQVLIGSTGADPAFGAVGVNSGLTAHGVLLAENNSAFVATSVGSNGQVFLGSSAADPAFGTLTTSTGIAYTTGAAALAIDVKTGGFAVVDQTSGSATLAVQTMYVTDNGASLVTYTLPSTAPQGSVIKIIGSSAGGWKVAQNASQQIKLGANATTSGTGGSMSSSNANSCVEMIASIGGASTIWTVASSSGTLTFV